MPKHLLLIDGGTTNTRVTLLDDRFSMLDKEKKAVGVSQTAVDGHNGQLVQAVKQAIDALLARNGLMHEDISRCIAYGMLTSNVGLVEIPHCVAPVGAKQLHTAMRCETIPQAAPFPIDFIPGVRNHAGAVNLETFPGMDMMRGEETEAVGLWELLSPASPCVFILPGSHNKFVAMDAKGAILRCMTTLSGELLNVLTHHTILADTVRRRFLDEEAYDLSFVLAGCREAKKTGLGRASFMGRILGTLGKSAPDKVANYLLGTVLQTDIQALKAFCTAEIPLFIAGKQPLQQALLDLLREEGFALARGVPTAVFEKAGLTGALKIALYADN